MNRFCTISMLVVALAVLPLISCKKEESNYYETGTPAFGVYQKDGEPESFYAYCASHDILLDSIYVTSPLNIKSKLYYQGSPFAREVHFQIGNSFIYRQGNWTFVFYGRKRVNGFSFTSYYQNDF